MNIDTDLQYAFTEGIRDYMNDNYKYISSQIGNPDDGNEPNKKYYDPRKWLRLGEETFNKRLTKAFEDLNNLNTLD
jgi:fructose-bisphosphate aldolase class II